ncbi:MotA/TolQ/ExbB proton channel family protein [Corallococcus sp. ZKHCc1 1396]|uniref:MotA/TolQ/ExbB proton channel family protein n=1 Tax=Corallococcus soli TaxID=2710757 RepID=A0ABR9PVR4_9BACT|nr:MULTISPECIES: MotA/TolQ/ExbB proton channel family protein [Corallococcus]MBE4752014.1 MotA/TolQ/ExbB proton channel family protein [Corallococcus soli]MCY1035517.1 MotA/TolQ/ExbB proton channel family protein [Corallococcus sp. BB11-1]
MNPSVNALLSMVLAEAAPAASQPPSGGLVDFVFTAFEAGGHFMLVNLFWLFASLAVIGERAVTLLFRYRLNASAFIEQVHKMVRSGNLDRAVKFCGMAPRSPLARVIRAGLINANRGEVEVAKSVEEALAEYTPHVTRRVQWLWSLANIATLVGLVGTIVGLIGTFRALGNVPADQKQALLSNGISEAMYNTGFGLSIAVICIVAHLFFHTYAKNMVETVELNALKLENLLSRRGSLEVVPKDDDVRAAS